MWSEEVVPADDPLRQGDLLTDVDLPLLKRPIPAIPLDFGAQANMQVPYRRLAGLVVSSCCSNTAEDYIAIAPVQPLSGLTEDQEAALLQTEPPDPASGGYQGYDIDHFRLEPLEGVLADPRRGSFQSAFLNRAIPFWGDCSDLRAYRRVRMTAAGRRLLRLNLALFWSRVERADIEELTAAELPVWF